MKITSIEKQKIEKLISIMIYLQPQKTLLELDGANNKLDPARRTSKMRTDGRVAYMDRSGKALHLAESLEGDLYSKISAKIKKSMELAEAMFGSIMYQQQIDEAINKIHDLTDGDYANFIVLMNDELQRVGS